MKKKYIVFLGILLIICLLLLFTINSKDNSKKYYSYEEFSTSKEVIEYMNEKYIKEEKSKDENFSKDVFVQLQTQLTLENESHYNNLMNLLIYVNQYENIRVIDEKNNITISVTCDKQNKQINQILINGIDKYFQMLHSQETLKNYNVTKNINVSLEGTNLENMKNQKWQISKIDLGKKDSTYDNYDIFFDEGIKVKIVNGNIFNLIFNDRYKEEIINGITTQNTKDEIISKLGEPQFYYDYQNVFGYKSDDIYIFFSDNEVSVYPITETDNDTENFFPELVNNFMQAKNINDFVYALTSKWQDYNEYDYNNRTYLLYSLRGIKINFDNSGEPGITIYSNYEGNILPNISIEDYKNSEEKISSQVLLELDKDLVYEIELQRQIINEEKYKKVYDENNISPDNKFGLVYIYDKENTRAGLKIISLDDEYFDYKIGIENLQSAVWLDEENFIYSREKSGIYKYNVYTKQNDIIYEGNEEFKNLSIENNVIKYDENKSIEF